MKHRHPLNTAKKPLAEPAAFLFQVLTGRHIPGCDRSPYLRLCPSLSEPLAVAHPDQVVVADLEALKAVAAVSLVLLDQEVFTAAR